MKRIELFIATILFLIALVINFYKVEELPPGMYGDEVSLGRKALELVTSRAPTPFMGEYSHPTPLLYLAAGSIMTFGHTVTAIRLPILIIGALNVFVFYFLMRQFFDRLVAILGSILMACCYTAIVLNRLAYEPPASTFFQILFFLFLVVFLKNKQNIFLIFAGIALGGGLYTYLNFRIFFLLAILACLILVKFKKTLLIFLAAIIIALPLIFYAFSDPKGFFLRSAEISVFGRGLSKEETAKELLGATTRTTGSFGIVGDPNPGKNPAGIAVFDIFTSGLFLIGVIILFKKERKIFWAMMMFILAAFLSDIFSIEQIPEFHYYGLGHPNALRVSGLIFPVIFCAIFALSKLRNYKWAIILITIFICAINLNWYFNQQEISPRWYTYNHQVNRASVLKIINYLNSSNFPTVNGEKDFIESEQRHFFLNPKINVFEIAKTASLSAVINNNSATVLLINPKNVNAIKEVINDKSIKGLVINNSLGQTEGVILFSILSSKGV